MIGASYTRMPWGKYEGHVLADVPASYLGWVLEESNGPEWLLAAVREELADRVGASASMPRPACDRCGRLLAEWPRVYRRLALAVHPDRGGTTEAMQLVVEADELLRV